MPETVVPLTTLVGTGAFLAGGLFGWAVRISDFCTLGAISDLALMGDKGRLRAWGLALAVALLGSQSLHAAGLVDLGRSIYLGRSITWAGAILGGLMFGYGMTQAGGCGSKALVRLGGGNLKSLVVVLVIGLFSMMTLKGLLAEARVALDQATSLSLEGGALSDQGLPALLTVLGLDAGLARAAIVLPLAVGLLVWCLKDPTFRSRRGRAAAAAAIGACVPLGWAITGILGADEFDPAPLASFTFIAPAGEALFYLMAYTGATITFGVAALAGVVAGAFLAAKTSGTFAVEGFADAADLRRHLVGAALMGSGGVLAMGCTVGQGLTGLSTLSASSFLAVGGIVAGALLGLRSLEEGGLIRGLRALLNR